MQMQRIVILSSFPCCAPSVLQYMEYSEQTESECLQTEKLLADCRLASLESFSHHHTVMTALYSNLATAFLSTLSPCAVSPPLTWLTFFIFDLCIFHLGWWIKIKKQDFCYFLQFLFYFEKPKNEWSTASKPPCFFFSEYPRLAKVPTFPTLGGDTQMSCTREIGMTRWLIQGGGEHN